MVFDTANSRAVMFGGMSDSSSGNYAYYNETWLWDGTNWTKATPANSPSARTGHHMAYDAQRGETVLYGGVDRSVLADTWVWNGSNWIQKNPATNPGPRQLGAAAYDSARGQVVLFGGRDGSGYSTNETWVWNGTDWTKRQPANSPSARYAHAMTWDSTANVLIMHGGYSSDGRLLSDTWSWNGTNWTEVTQPADSPPMANAVMVSHGGRPMLINGSHWIWNGSAWNLLITNPSLPADVQDAAAVYDPVRDRTILHGGRKPYRGTYQSTWQFTLGSGCTFLVGAVPLSISTSSGSSAIEITVPGANGCAWTATTDESWITINNPNGAGTGTLSVSIAPNPGPLPRTGYVRVGSGRVYVVSQQMPPCPTGGPLPPSPFGLRVECSVTFSYTAAAGEQIAIEGIGNSASRPGTYSYSAITISGPAPATTVLATSSPAGVVSNTGVVTFPTSGTYSISFALQGAGFPVRFEWMKSGSGCTPSVLTDAGLTQPSPAVPSYGRWVLSVALPPGCPSLPVTAPEWLTPGVASVQPGFSGLEITAKVNYGPARTGTVTVGTVAMEFRQNAAECTYSISPTSVFAGAGRSSGNISITTQPLCRWDASSNVPWIQVYPLDNTQTNEAPRYTIFPNFSSRSRTGTVTVAGQTLTVVQSAEGGTATERFVKLLYFNFFGRLPSAPEVAFQVNAGLSRAQLTWNFLNSAEFNNGGRFIAGLYVGLLNRDPEFGGWLFQRDALSTGISSQMQSVYNFLNSLEFRSKGISGPRDFIRTLYRQVLLREPTTAEVDFHVSTLATLQAHGVAMNFLLTPEFTAGTGPRLTAFLAYATLLQRQPSATEFGDAAALVRQAQTLPQDQRQVLIRDQLLGVIANSIELNALLN